MNDQVSRLQRNLHFNENLVNTLVERAYELVSELELGYREYDRLRWSEEFDQLSEDDQRELERIGRRINDQISAIKTAGQGRRP